MSRYAYLWAGGRTWSGIRDLLAGWEPRRGANATFNVYGVRADGAREVIGGVVCRGGAVELVDIEPAWPEGEEEAVDGSDEANPPEAGSGRAAEPDAPGVRRA